jgi:hypothetical protein
MATPAPVIQWRCIDCEVVWDDPSKSDARYVRRLLSRELGVPFKQVPKELVEEVLAECPLCGYWGGVRPA